MPGPGRSEPHDAERPARRGPDSQRAILREAADGYTPRSPDQTLLHRIVREQLETFLAHTRSRDQPAPRFVEQEFRAYLRCGVLSHGFLRVHCDACGLDRVVAFLSDTREPSLKYLYPQRAVAWIGELYDVERDVEKAEVLDRAAHRLRLRHERSRPIVEALRAWITTVPSLSQSSLGKALAYTDTLWPGLVRFLDDPAIPLDNNATERALRGVVLGRKNHYGSKSQRGTEVAALFYSLLESAKLSGLEPARYLAEATRRALANPGTATLPRDLLPA
jgi:hypothetical protein